MALDIIQFTNDNKMDELVEVINTKMKELGDFFYISKLNWL